MKLKEMLSVLENAGLQVERENEQLIEGYGYQKIDTYLPAEKIPFCISYSDDLKYKIRIRDTYTKKTFIQETYHFSDVIGFLVDTLHKN